MKKAFTLLELIVVIIVLGILATLGYTQYTKVVEKGRGTELRMTIGNIRKLAFEYRLKNGSCAGITLSDVNIGTASDQFPSDCRSSHYFNYNVSCSGPPTMQMWGTRCTAGGKTPQGPEQCWTQLNENLDTGVQSDWFSNCTQVKY